MKLIKKFFSLFSGLRGRLTLTYTLVTVSALLSIQVLGLLLMAILLSATHSNEYEYISDIIFTLNTDANDYIEVGDFSGLQSWLDRVYASGFASLEPINFMDSPAAPIVVGQPMFAIGRDGTIIAQSPSIENNLISRTYAPPAYEGAAEAYQLALANINDPLNLFVDTPDGDYFVAAPVWSADDQTPLGVIIVIVEPSPTVLYAIWPYFLLIVVVTGSTLLIGVIPFGALFGFIMSRSLTRRLADLSLSADSWSKGDFSIQPKDRSRDEIGQLAVRLKHMAEEINSLIQTRQELASLEARNRLARDLHDTVKQQVFATLMQVRAARNLLKNDPHKAENHLEEVEKLVKASSAELEMLIAELRPAALDGQGLPAALEAYIQTWSTHAGIPCDLQVHQQQDIPLHIEQSSYRVVQEALANINRHSSAGEARIRITYENDHINMDISDNGDGFDPHQVQEGFGLMSMEQRALELDGSFSITSQPGDGTTISISIPLREGAENE